MLLLTSASIKPVRLIGWFAAQAQNMWNIVDRGSRVCLNVQANSFWSEIQAAWCTTSCNNPNTRNCISEATTGNFRSLLLENSILLGWKQRPQRFSTCHSTTNESAMGRRLSRDPSGCEPPLWVMPPGFTMEYPRELDPDSQSETAPLPSQKCQGCTMARGPAAAKILDAFSLFPFISCHIHSCHFLPSFIIFSHFSPHQGSSFRSI